MWSRILNTGDPVNVTFDGVRYPCKVKIAKSRSGTFMVEAQGCLFSILGAHLSSMVLVNGPTGYREIVTEQEVVLEAA